MNPIVAVLFAGFKKMFTSKEFLPLLAVYAKWYLMIMPIAIGAVYKIYMAMEAHGHIPERFYNYVHLILLNITDNVDRCSGQLVIGLHAFFYCLH